VARSPPGFIFNQIEDSGDAEDGIRELAIRERDEKIRMLQTENSLLKSRIDQETKKTEISKKKQLEFLNLELSCSICYEVFVQPVRLPCLHIFCQTCILQNEKTRKTCPLCRISYIFGRTDLLLLSCIKIIIESAFSENEKSERDELVTARQDSAFSVTDLDSDSGSDASSLSDDMISYSESDEFTQ
jgi:hypothetical protein